MHLASAHGGSQRGAWRAFSTYFIRRSKRMASSKRLFVMAQIAARLLLQNPDDVDELLRAEEVMHPLAGRRMRHLAHQRQRFGRQSHHEAREGQVLRPDILRAGLRRRRLLIRRRRFGLFAAARSNELLMLLVGMPFVMSMPFVAMLRMRDFGRLGAGCSSASGFASPSAEKRRRSATLNPRSFSSSSAIGFD